MPDAPSNLWTSSPQSSASKNQFKPRYVTTDITNLEEAPIAVQTAKPSITVHTAGIVATLASG